MPEEAPRTDMQTEPALGDTSGQQRSAQDNPVSAEGGAKRSVVHPHTGMSLGFKRKGILTGATGWMNLEGLKLCEINQSQRTHSM